MNGIKLQTIPKYTILTDRKGEYLLTEITAHGHGGILLTGIKWL